MDGSNVVAEQLRRYPLTWTTIGCLLERISLFSLSRIFLERKFLHVLQQSAKDISNSETQEASKPPKSKKRKRDQPVTFELEELRSPETLLISSSELFGALGKLLERLDSTSDLDEGDLAIGVEHIRSLFRTPVEDTRDLVAPLLWICTRSLDLLPLYSGLSRKQLKWPKILITLWDLHQGSTEDSRVFASQLYYPCCIIIDRLSDSAKVGENLDRNQSWISRFEKFVTKNLVNPAKNSFTNGQGLSTLELANAASSKGAALCVKTLWRLVAQTRHDLDDQSSKKTRLAWTQTVFKLLLSFAEELKVVEYVIAPLLSTARFHGCPPELEIITYVCKVYCFNVPETDWKLLSDIIQCDSDVFLLDDNLQNVLFGRITSVVACDDFEMGDIVEGIINPLMEAFAKTRDLIGFVKKWHGQLSKLLAQNTSLEKSPWYDCKARMKCASLTQGTLSAQQVSTLVDWLQVQVDAGAHLVILDAICQGLKEEAYVDKLSTKLLNTVLDETLSPDRVSTLTAARWRITKIVASWVPATEVSYIWNKVKDNMSRTLSSGSLSNPAMLEAFSCCSQLCRVNYPLGNHLEDISAVVTAFLKRIIAEVKDSSRVPALSDYLDLIFSQLPPLGSISGGDEQISTYLGLLYNRLQSGNPNVSENSQKELLKSILRKDVVEDEEELVGAFAQPLIDALEDSSVCAWTTPSDGSTILGLLNFAPEAFIKDRRKKIMSSWRRWRSEINAHAAENTGFYILVLRLLIMVMAQPTFYDVSRESFGWPSTSSPMTMDQL
jgi:nucleolar pre-ribosomal-associated protein 2